jgi:RND family efflux transporter MFP subunit
MRKLITMTLLTVGLAGLGCTSSSFRPDGESGTAQATPNTRAATVMPVEVATPVRQDISDYARTDSRVEAENRVEVTTEVVGRCIKVNVDEGDNVTRGQVLAELDKNEQLAQLRQQEAQMFKTEKDYKRSLELYKNGLTSLQEYETAMYTHKQQIETVNQTREQLSKLTIKAPIDGIVSQRDVQPGQIVTSGTPIFTVIDPTSYMLVLNIEESQLPRLREGQRALVTIDALGEMEFEATVRRVNPAIDKDYGTVRVIVDFKKEDIPKLRESAFARVNLVMDTHENALLVPKEAVVEMDARKYVFLVESEDPEKPATSDDARTLARRVEVQTGLENSNFVEITSEMDDDAVIITLGQETLKSGTPVKVTTAEGELEAAGMIDAEAALAESEARKARGATERSILRGPE